MIRWNRPTVSAIWATLLLLPWHFPSAFAAQSPKVAVLAYHRFDPEKAGPTTVETRVFEAQLVWLAAHQYRVVPLRSLVEALHDPNRTLEARAVVISVDDGHRSVYTEMFPVIRRYHVPVTLFIYPSAISNASYALTWPQLQEMQASGLVDIESHTYWHPNFRKERKRRTPADFRTFVAFQLDHSKEILERKLGTSVTTLAWPYGIYDSELEQAAAQAGYKAAFAYAGGLAYSGCDLFAVPRIPVSNADQGPRFAALLAQVHAGKTRKP